MKMSFKMLGAAAMLCASAAFAEGGMFEGYLPENWTADVVAAVKFTNVNYRNWAEDGNSSYTWLVTYNADVQGKWKVANWRNLIDLQLGQTWTDGLGKRKSADKIFWESMLDFNMTKELKPYVGARYETQFMPGYNYSEDENGEEIKTAVSCFMDPVYLTQMAGLAYIPNEMFSQRLGFANRMTVSHGYGYADDHYQDKVDAGKREQIKEFKDEPGLESVTEFKFTYGEIMNFKTRLWAFVNFKGVDEIDGKWENLLGLAFDTLIELQVGFDMVYDKNLDKDAQYKNMILFGITWRWF